jgi:hypothetical protein
MGLMAALAMSGPAMAGIGSVTFDLTSGGGNGPVFIPLGVGAFVPVEVSFTATASGTSGGNRGVAGVNFDLNTSLPISDQTPMTLAKVFTNKPSNGATSTTGAGFASFTDGGAPTDAGGDAGKETISAVGGFQGLAADFSFTTTMGVMGTMHEFVGHSGPQLMAFSGLIVDPATPAGTYIVQLLPNSASVWSTPGLPATQELVGTGEGDVFGDTLMLVVVPEPATMLLLVPVAWAIRRRHHA